MLDLKQAIYKEKDFAIEAINLIFKGLLLVDTKGLKECKIEEGANIVIMIKKVNIRE